MGLEVTITANLIESNIEKELEDNEIIGRISYPQEKSQKKYRYLFSFETNEELGMGTTKIRKCITETKLALDYLFQRNFFPKSIKLTYKL